MEAFKHFHPSVCPHLGTFDDPETHFSFATASNYCYHVSPPEMIDLTHQDVYCLSDEFKICPKFLHEILDTKAEPLALPTDSQGSPLPDSTETDIDSGSILPESNEEVEDSSPQPAEESHIESTETQDLPESSIQQLTPESNSTKAHTLASVSSETDDAQPQETALPFTKKVIALDPKEPDLSEPEQSGHHPKYSQKPSQGVKPQSGEGSRQTEQSQSGTQLGGRDPLKDDELLDITSFELTSQKPVNNSLAILVAAIFLVILAGIFINPFGILIKEPEEFPVPLPQISDTPTETQVMPTATLVPTQLSTETPVDTPIPTIVPTDTSTPIPTLFPTASYLTPGPLLGTPFGVDQQYLVHKIVIGESLPLLEARYETTQDVILIQNEALLIYGFQPDRNIVIMPGRTDLANLETMSTYYVESEITLEDFATQNGVSVTELRDINNLPPGDSLPINRWIVYPQREVIPTPTLTPLVSPDLSKALTPPFGPDRAYILHRVNPGESMPIIENLYLTSAEVIQTANRIEGSVRLDQVLVIIINQTDPTDIPLFGVLNVEGDISVDDLSLFLDKLPADLIHYNDLNPDEIIKSGTWIIYPIR